jgi:hypothetical protein
VSSSLNGVLLLLGLEAGGCSAVDDRVGMLIWNLKRKRKVVDVDKVYLNLERVMWQCARMF